MLHNQYLSALLEPAGNAVVKRLHGVSLESFTDACERLNGTRYSVEPLLRAIHDLGTIGRHCSNGPWGNYGKIADVAMESYGDLFSDSNLGLSMESLVADIKHLVGTKETIDDIDSGDVTSMVTDGLSVVAKIYENMDTVLGNVQYLSADKMSDKIQIEAISDLFFLPAAKGQLRLFVETMVPNGLIDDLTSRLNGMGIYDQVIGPYGDIVNENIDKIVSSLDGQFSTYNAMSLSGRELLTNEQISENGYLGEPFDANGSYYIKKYGGSDVVYAYDVLSVTTSQRTMYECVGVGKAGVFTSAELDALTKDEVVEYANLLKDYLGKVKEILGVVGSVVGYIPTISNVTNKLLASADHSKLLSEHGRVAVHGILLDIYKNRESAFSSVFDHATMAVACAVGVMRYIVGSAKNLAVLGDTSPIW